MFFFKKRYTSFMENKNTHKTTSKMLDNSFYLIVLLPLMGISLILGLTASKVINFFDKKEPKVQLQEIIQS